MSSETDPSFVRWIVHRFARHCDEEKMLRNKLKRLKVSAAVRAEVENILRTHPPLSECVRQPDK